MLSGPARRGCPDSRMERMLQHNENKTLQSDISGPLKQWLVADDQNWASHDEKVSTLHLYVSHGHYDHILHFCKNTNHLDYYLHETICFYTTLIKWQPLLPKMQKCEIYIYMYTHVHVYLHSHRDIVRMNLSLEMTTTQIQLLHISKREGIQLKK